MGVLLFLHVLAAMVLLGAALVAAGAALAARRAPRARPALLSAALAGAVVTVITALLAIALGEALAAEEDLAAPWLDASRGVAVLGLLGGGLAAALLTRLSFQRPRLAGAAGWTSAAVAAAAVAVSFLMAAKPA